MVYLTNDDLDQAVYFEFRGSQPRRLRGGMEHVVYGLVGNGVTEVAVTVRSGRFYEEMIFGRDDLFRVVEERLLRRLISETVRELMFPVAEAA